MAVQFPTDYTLKSPAAASDKVMIADAGAVDIYTTIEDLLKVLSDITIDSPTFSGSTRISSLILNGVEVTATGEEINAIAGLLASVEELNYSQGLTSNIQDQLDAKAGSGDVTGFATTEELDLKAPIANPVFTGAVSIGGYAPNEDAILDLNSSSKCLIIPRMSTTARDAMTPVVGMMLYNTTTKQYETYLDGANIGWWMIRLWR